MKRVSLFQFENLTNKYKGTCQHNSYQTDFVSVLKLYGFNEQNVKYTKKIELKKQFQFF